MRQFSSALAVVLRAAVAWLLALLARLGNEPIDHFGVVAILKKRVFEGLRAIDEQAAIEAILFLGDPMAAFVFADKDNG